jgi:hypothetical protein
MKHKSRFILFLSALIMVTLACSLLPGAAAKVDLVATSVAGTLAVSGDLPQSSSLETPPPAPDAPETSEAPLELAPTSTGDSFVAPTTTLTIVYVVGGNVWFWEEGGVGLQLTDTGNVLDVFLSDDGQVAAFTASLDVYTEELWAVNTDGSDLRRLVGEDDFSMMVTRQDAVGAVPYQIDFVPGTHRIAFNTRLLFEGPGLLLQDDLWMVDADDPGIPRSILPPGQGGGFSYSRDGRKIALVRADQISIFDAAGSVRRDLHSFTPVMTYSEYQYYPTVFWTLDSSALRTIIPPQDPLADPAAATQVLHLPIDGSPSSLLAEFEMTPFFSQPAVLSPDTNRLAYVAPGFSGDPYSGILRITNTDGTDNVDYDGGQIQFLGWSPDNRRFIYAVNDASHIGEVGSHTVPLSGITSMRNVRWVDPNRYLYLNRSDTSWELVLGQLGGGPFLIARTAPSGNLISYDFLD